MSEISPVIRTNAAPPTTGVRGPKNFGAASAVGREGDKVEFSSAAQLLSRMSELPDVRQDLVDRVREQIDNGTYETPEKIDAAIESLIDDLG